jgi:hypothetical protein
MELSNFCAHAVKTKMSSKIYAHAMKTPTYSYQIYHKNRICMRLHVWTWSSDWAGVYDISINYLRYFCELFTLLRKKQKRNLWSASHARVGCWTGSLTAAWGSFDLVHGGGPHPTAWRGVWVGAPTWSS